MIQVEPVQTENEPTMYAVSPENVKEVKEKPVKRTNWKRLIGQIVIHLVIISLLFMVLFPFYILIANSLKQPTDILLKPLALPGTAATPMVLTGYTYAWADIRSYILNTVLVAVAEIVGVLLFASMAAYGFERFRFRGKDALFTVFLVFMMIPGILTLAPQYKLVSSTYHLRETLAGIYLPAIAGGMPVGIFLIRTFFAGVPDSIFEAAELDGASHFRRYLTMALPLCMPILFTIGLSTLLGAWNDMIWAQLILEDKTALYTISVGVFVKYKTSSSVTPENVIFAGYCIASIPLVFAFFLTSKQFIKGLTSGAIKM